MIEGNCRYCGRYFTPHEEQIMGVSFNYVIHICALCAPSVCHDCAHKKEAHATWCNAATIERLTSEIEELKREADRRESRLEEIRVNRDESIRQVIDFLDAVGEKTLCRAVQRLQGQGETK